MPGRLRGFRAGVVILLGYAVTSCGKFEQTRILPSVERRDGIEIATLAQIPGVLEEEYRWRFRILREITTEGADPDAAPLVFNPTSVLPLRSGDLLLHDPHADRPLVIVDPRDGSLVARFGRTGQGPGELLSRIEIAQATDGTIVVLDADNRQLHEYSEDGTYVASRRLEVDAYLLKLLAWPEGHGYLVELFRRFERGITRELGSVGFASGAVQPFLQLPEPARGSEPGMIQLGRAIWTILGNDVVVMRSDQPFVHIYDHDGVLIREIRFPWSNRIITEADISEQVAHYGDIARSLRPGPAALTNELYALNDSVFGMLLSSLWRAAEDPPLPAGTVLWRMFTVRGEYIGVVWLPEDFRFLGYGAGTIWARVLNESGIPVIQELELVPPGETYE